VSAVELGVCVFEDRKIVEQRGWRFYPLEDNFDHKTCKYSGIFAADVEGLPRFNQMWPVMKPYFETDVLVAQNLRFDLGILHRHLAEMEELLPDVKGFCTVEMARDALPDLPNHRLPTICDELKVHFSSTHHHGAVVDARACGESFWRLQPILKRKNVELDRFAHDVAAFDPDQSRTSIGDTEDFQPYGSYTGIPLHDPDSFRRNWDEDDLLDIDDEDEDADEEDDSDEKSWVQAIDQLLESLELKGNDDFLREWAFAITGETVVDRQKLAEVVSKLGAKCDRKNQSFAMSSRAAHGPTNALVFADDVQLQRCLNSDPNTKFSKFSEALTKAKREPAGDGGDAPSEG
jgi:DNA polymerase-3 subunit epsilon